MTTADWFTVAVAALYTAAAVAYGFESNGVKCLYFAGCAACTILILWMK